MAGTNRCNCAGVIKLAIFGKLPTTQFNIGHRVRVEIKKEIQQKETCERNEISLNTLLL